MAFIAPRFYSLIKKSERVWACGTRVLEETCKGFLWGNLEERDHLEDIDEDGKIKMKSSSNKMRVFSLGRYGSGYG